MNRIVLVLLVAGLAGNAHANKTERWYTYWGLGYADITYPGDLDDAMDALADLPGVDHVSIALDGLGFYVPQGDQRMVGLIANCFGDRYDVGDDWIQADGYLLSLSAMHFTRRIGQGPFLRADGGLAWYVLDTSWGLDDTSDRGYGFLVGGGFAFPVADGTRILLNANYAVRHVEGENTKTLGISVGGLF